MAGHVHLLYSDKVLGEMLQRQLRSEFFHVTLSQETAPEAMIAALTHEQPEVISLIRGPNTPFERFRLLKQAFPHRALVALDPIPSKASSLAALHQGADGSIALPQAPALLSLQMGAWLRQSRKQEEAAANDDVMRLLGFDPLLLAVPSEQLGGLCLEVRHEDPASAAVLVQRLGETGFHCDPQPLSDPSSRQAPGRAKDGLVIGALSRDGWHRALGLSAQERELVTAESKRLGQKVHQLFNGGNYREALQVAEEQMELLKNAYGPNHHEYATAMNNVATLFQALGRYSEAEPLLLEASRIQGRTLGPDHPHTVASLSNLATVYEAMGQAERAAAMHSLVAVHKKTWAEKQKQAQKNR